MLADIGHYKVVNGFYKLHAFTVKITFLIIGRKRFGIGEKQQKFKHFQFKIPCPVIIPDGIKLGKNMGSRLIFFSE